MTRRSNLDATTHGASVKRISGTPPARSGRMTRAASRKNPTRIQRAKTEAILGTMQACVDMIGTGHYQHVQEMIADGTISVLEPSPTPR